MYKMQELIELRRPKQVAQPSKAYQSYIEFLESKCLDLERGLEQVSDIAVGELPEGEQGVEVILNAVTIHFIGKPRLKIKRTIETYHISGDKTTGIDIMSDLDLSIKPLASNHITVE